LVARDLDFVCVTQGMVFTLRLLNLFALNLSLTRGTGQQNYQSIQNTTLLKLEISHTFRRCEERDELVEKLHAFVCVAIDVARLVNNLFSERFVLI
jgi:hypothetical protein